MAQCGLFVNYGNGGCSRFALDSLLISVFDCTENRENIYLYCYVILYNIKLNCQSVLVNASFKHSYIRQISVVLVKIKTVADNKFVWHIYAYIVGFNISLSS